SGAGASRYSRLRLADRHYADGPRHDPAVSWIPRLGAAKAAGGLSQWKRVDGELGSERNLDLRGGAIQGSTGRRGSPPGAQAVAGSVFISSCDWPMSAASSILTK